MRIRGRVGQVGVLGNILSLAEEYNELRTHCWLWRKSAVSWLRWSVGWLAMRSAKRCRLVGDQRADQHVTYSRRRFSTNSGENRSPLMYSAQSVMSICAVSATHLSDACPE